jgi:hypothetical protein
MENIIFPSARKRAHGKKVLAAEYSFSVGHNRLKEKRFFAESDSRQIFCREPSYLP